MSRWTALVAPALSFALFLLVAILEDRVSRSGALSISTERVRLRAEPSVLEQLGSRPVRDLRLPPGRIHLDDPELREQIEAWLEPHPLVLSVREIDRTFPKSLDVHLELRRPVAVVCYGQRGVLVDASGVALTDGTIVGDRRRFALPAIEPPPGSMTTLPKRGVRFLHRRLGEVGHAAVGEALNVLNHLTRPPVSEHPVLERIRFTAIRVGWSDPDWHPGRPGIELVIENGPTVYWGHCPDAPFGAGYRGEIDKLDRLQRLLLRRGGLRGITRIDATLDDPEIEFSGVR